MFSCSCRCDTTFCYKCGEIGYSCSPENPLRLSDSFGEPALWRIENAQDGGATHDMASRSHWKASAKPMRSNSWYCYAARTRTVNHQPLLPYRSRGAEVNTVEANKPVVMECITTPKIVLPQRGEREEALAFDDGETAESATTS